ncbi:MAG TPA: site-specific integrase [Solirubrobacteraceae bacterium]|nr:site-specific integrase [Solirubrobacteraceae bacterium]
MPRQPNAALLVVEREEGPVYYAKWREDGRQVKRRLGPAWIERGEHERAGERRRTRHRGWIKRRGRPTEGHLSEDAALALIPGVIAERAEEYIRERERQEREREREISLDEIADAWLAHRVNVMGIKRSTLNHYRTMLLRSEETPRKRGRAPKARIMSRFAGRPAASITTREVARWLAELDNDPQLSARSVNQHRQVLHSIYGYACREDTFGLAENPVARTEKRREADPAEIITYTPAEVEAIARAAQEGSHRENRLQLTEAEIEARAQEDDQDGCLILVAAFCGLRMGECLALRWRHVMWDAQRLHVQRSYVLGQEDSPKGRRGRSVPLADQPAQALARLSQRPTFTRPADLVFCSRTGEHLDASALRRRYKAARDAAIAQNPDMASLRFHDLRHTFGTLAAQGFDLVNVQAMMGHADSRTTARYLHARPAAEDAAKLTKIFAKNMPSAIVDEPVDVA